MIETWEAVRFEGVKRRGRTKPLIIGAERQAGSGTLRNVFITKPIGNPEVTADLLCHELLGHLVARYFGCRTFPFALVELSPDFIDANADAFAREGVAPSAGLAFGSQQTEHLLPFAGANPTLRAELIPAAARVYCLDMVLQNTDRRIGNHNCALLDDDVVIWDFDQAFSFRYPIIGGTVPCWEVGKLGFRRNHVFYSSLQNKPIDWSWVPPIAAGIASQIDAWHAALPVAWEPGSRPLLDTIAEIAPKSTELVRELALSLV